MAAPIHHLIPNAPKPVGPYSHVVEADGWLFVTGQLATDPDDDSLPLPKGIEAQTRKVMDNLQRALAGVGAGFEHVVCVRIFLTDFERDYAALNRVYTEYFEPSRLPARTASFFYQTMNASTRRDMTNAAVCRVLDGNPILSEWSALYERITKLTGSSSERNLLGHAVIRQEVLTKQGPISSSGFLGLTETTISYRVERDAALLLAGREKARAADFASLLAYCEEIISVLSDLDSFLAKLP